ncbi:unnamed protein product, partial [Prorocentrum cordatum]
SPGLELALDRCPGVLGVGPAPAARAAECATAPQPLCALLPLPAWLGLAALLLLVGFFVGIVSRGCCEPRQRARVLSDYLDDPDGRYWHLRLLPQTDGNGLWTVVASTVTVRVLDLSRPLALPLDRNELIPAPYCDECFIFDSTSAAELAEFERRGEMPAAAHGNTAAGVSAPDTVWLDADPTHEALASAEPEAAVADPACAVAHEAGALVLVDHHRVHAEAEEAGREEVWRLDRVTAFGRAPRVTGLRRARHGGPYSSEADTLALYGTGKSEHFPLSGPPVAAEFLQSLRAQGQSPASYHHEWAGLSRVNVHGAPAREHFFLSEMLRWQVQFNPTGVSMLASAGLVLRRPVHIEAAAQRFAKVPDLTGLDMLMSVPPDKSGAATTAVFIQAAADRQKDQATIAKQRQLDKEAERKRASDPKSKGSAPAEALFELLNTSDMYDTEPQGLEVFDADRLKVLKRPTNPKPLESVLSSFALTQHLESERRLERAAAEVEARIQDGLITPVKPYWDPKLRASRPALFALLKDLLARGLGGLRASIRARIALAFRAKKGGSQRVIVDAREANQLTQEPPHVQLGGPGALRDLDLSDAAFEIAGCDPRGADVRVASLDLHQGFYQCRAKRLGRWFGVEFGFAAREWGVSPCCDEDAERGVPVDGDTALYSVMEVLCVGFSWALYFCRAIMEDAALAAAGPRARAPGRPLLPLGGLLREGAPALLVAPGRPVFSVYVDNGAVIGFNRADTQRGQDRYLARLEEMGFIVHDIEPAQTGLTAVGLRFLGGSQLELLPTEKYTWRLYLAIERLLQQGRCPGVALERVVGHLVNHFLLMPWGLSALDQCHRFLQRYGRRDCGWFSESLVAELRVLKGLVKLVDVDLAAPRAPVVFSGDSSTFSYSLSFARASPSDILDADRLRERWRFKTEEISFTELPGDGGRAASCAPVTWPQDRPARAAGPTTLGLADNLSALLAFMKGRASDFWLRLLVRQAAALAIGAEIVSHLRCIESPRNCADRDSRAADRGEVAPGATILGDTRGFRLALDPVLLLFLLLGAGGAAGGPPRRLGFWAPAEPASLEHCGNMTSFVRSFKLPQSVFVEIDMREFAAWRATLAGACPPSLCRAWAAIAAAAAPRGSRLGAGEDGYAVGRGKWRTARLRAAGVDAATSGPRLDPRPADGVRASGPSEPAPGEAATTAGSRRGRPRSAKAEPLATKRPRAAARAARAGKRRAAATATPAKAVTTRQHHLKTRSVPAKIAAVYEGWRCRTVRIHGRAPLADLGGLGKILEAFVPELYFDGEAVSAGRMGLAAVAFSLNLSFADKGVVPRAKRALQGWRKEEPEVARDPCPWVALALTVKQLVKQGVLLQDGCFLPSEVLNIRQAGVADVSARGPLAVRVAPALPRSPDEQGRPSPPAKTAKYYDAVLTHDKVPMAAGQRYLRKLMETLLADSETSTAKLFPTLKLAKFERLFSKTAANASLAELRLTPHRPRRGGPSEDVLGRYRSFAEVQERGRWEAKASVTDYAKGGRVLPQAGRMTDQQPRYGNSLMHRLALLLQLR